MCPVGADDVIGPPRLLRQGKLRLDSLPRVLAQRGRRAQSPAATCSAGSHAVTTTVSKSASRPVCDSSGMSATATGHRREGGKPCRRWPDTRPDARWPRDRGAPSRRRRQCGRAPSGRCCRRPTGRPCQTFEDARGARRDPVRAPRARGCRRQSWEHRDGRTAAAPTTSPSQSRRSARPCASADVRPGTSRAGGEPRPRPPPACSS